MSARSASSRTCLSSRSRSSQCGHGFHLLMMRRPDSRPPRRPCVSARSGSIRTDPSARSRSEVSCPCLRLLLLCRLGCKPPTRPCDCDEMSQHTKQLRQGKKIRRQNRKIKTYKLECPVSVDWHSKVPAEPTDQTLTELS